MKCLNLYAGIGGNRKLWTDCKVTAVEINPDIAVVYKELFPQDEVIIGDAHEYLLKHFHKFDFIWSSPPCQSHSKMRICNTKVRVFPDLSLYQEIIFLNRFVQNPWVVENVVPYYDPLIKPNVQFNRHLFWSNFSVGFRGVRIPPKGNVTRMSPTELEKWSGMSIKRIPRVKPIRLLRNVVHPLMGQQIFLTAKRVWERRQSNKEKGILTPKPRGFGF